MLSLSSVLRDYLYFPLGGNRKGPARTYVNLAIVMLLGGLWHGAKWNFVVWGAFHGVLETAIRDTLDLAQHCEALGYHRYWVAEHHSMPGIASSSPAVLLECVVTRSTVMVAEVTMSFRSGRRGNSCRR